jgi:hypothetical protein
VGGGVVGGGVVGGGVVGGGVVGGGVMMYGVLPDPACPPVGIMTMTLTVCVPTLFSAAGGTKGLLWPVSNTINFGSHGTVGVQNGAVSLSQ